MLIDSLGRQITYLRISVTDRCNSRCVYCMPLAGVPWKSHDEILRYEEIAKIVRVMAAEGVRAVRLTGGEPLVRPNLPELVGMLAAIPGIEDISLTTNGILLEEFAGQMFDAGVRRINVSLDSLDKDKYFRITNGGNLDAVLRGIIHAQEVGFSPIKINTVLIKGFNDNEALEFARLAAEMPFQVRFIELMPMGKTNLRDGEEYMPATELIEKISQTFALEPLKGKKNKSDGPARIYKIKNGQGEIGFINPVSDHFCSTCNRLRLTSDGKLRACLLNEAYVDLKAALRENCSDAELEKLIWDAVLLKPRKHDVVCTDNTMKKCTRIMSEIGG